MSLLSKLVVHLSLVLIVSGALLLRNWFFAIAEQQHPRGRKKVTGEYVPPRLLSWWSEELREGGCGIRREHEVLADEEGIEAGDAEPLQVVVGAQAGLADGDAIVRNVLDQFVRSLHAHGECFQVAIVHAEDARAGRKRAG